MKSTIKNLILSATVMLCSTGIALARPTPCGSNGVDCELPGPSTLPLLVAAIGVAAMIAKFRKK